RRASRSRRAGGGDAARRVQASRRGSLRAPGEPSQRRQGDRGLPQVLGNCARHALLLRYREAGLISRSDKRFVPGTISIKETEAMRALITFGAFGVLIASSGCAMDPYLKDSATLGASGQF